MCSWGGAKEVIFRGRGGIRPISSPSPGSDATSPKMTQAQGHELRSSQRSKGLNVAARQTQGLGAAVNIWSVATDKFMLFAWVMRVWEAWAHGAESLCNTDHVTSDQLLRGWPVSNNSQWGSSQHHHPGSKPHNDIKSQAIVCNQWQWVPNLDMIPVCYCSALNLKWNIFIQDASEQLNLSWNMLGEF